MDSKYTYRDLDIAVDLVIKRIFALAKDTGEIIITGLGPDNDKHRALYAICEIEREIFGIETYIKTKLLTYFKITAVFPKTQKRLKSALFKKFNKETVTINAGDFLSSIETDLQKPDILEEVYRQYYEVKKWQ